MRLTTLLVAVQSASDYRFICDAVRPDDSFRVLPCVRGLMQTFSAVEEHNPNMVLIDRALTQRPEFETMRALFETFDIRWLIWDHGGSGGAGGSSGRSAPCAMTPGADLFFLDASMPSRQLLDHLRSVGRSGRARMTMDTPAPVAAPRVDHKTILIGASTGGVDALLQVLADFPADCPPTVIVQHTGQNFGASLVSLLAMRCKPKVRLCAEGAVVQPGEVHVAAGLDGHAVLCGTSRLRLSIEGTGPVNGHRPSVDRLFSSAVPIARKAVATLLTGMGNDGAAGLLALRSAGARTLSQDEASSVVYGMPRVAWDMKASERQLPIDRMGKALLDLAGDTR